MDQGFNQFTIITTMLLRLLLNVVWSSDISRRLQCLQCLCVAMKTPVGLRSFGDPAGQRLDGQLLEARIAKIVKQPLRRCRTVEKSQKEQLMKYWCTKSWSQWITSQFQQGFMNLRILILQWQGPSIHNSYCPWHVCISDEPSCFSTAKISVICWIRGRHHHPAGSWSNWTLWCESQCSGRLSYSLVNIPNMILNLMDDVMLQAFTLRIGLNLAE